MAIVNHLSNYYEQMVAEEIHHQLAEEDEHNRDLMIDVACVALNRLPPKYYRYQVDMVFYMSSDELRDIKQRVSSVVQESIAFVRAHKRLDEHQQG